MEKRQDGELGMSGIASFGVYRPRMTLDSQLATTLGLESGARFGAPDEDALTMSWEALSRLPEPSDEGVLLLAVPADSLEPRAFAAHLRATGVVDPSTGVVAVEQQADLANVLAVARHLRDGTAGVLVDRRRSGDALATPTADVAVAVRFGEPRIASIGDPVEMVTMSFDRWRESEGRGDRDPRFVEDRLVVREGREVFDRLRKQVVESDSQLVGVVVTAPVPLKPGRLAQMWDLDAVHLADPAALEPGAARASSLITAVELLASAGPGASVAVMSLGWGASGVVLTAGPEIGSASATSRPPTGAYGMRSWLMAHRPPYTASPWTSASELSREASDLLGLVGIECAACGARQFPRAGVCEQCGSLEVRPTQVQRVGSVITHSIDELYGAPDTTVQMVVAALDGGAQFYGQAAQDVSPWLQINERCRLSLRRLHTGSGLPHYYWKVDRDD